MNLIRLLLRKQSNLVPYCLLYRLSKYISSRDSRCQLLSITGKYLFKDILRALSSVKDWATLVIALDCGLYQHGE